MLIYICPVLQELHWLWAVAEVWPLHEQAHTVVLLPGIQHQGQQNVPLHHRQFHEGTVTYWRKLMSNKILQSFINFIDSSVSNYFLQTNMPVSWHMYHISFRLLLAMHKCYIHLYRNFSEIFLVIFFFQSDSLYNDGMKPLIYSEKNAQQKKVGWVRGGSDIKYYKNNLRYETSPMPFFTESNCEHSNFFSLV